jgi:2-oxoglutarate dehydrogenase E2 component (dihydrolipoamide succinyltransferase)
MIVDIKVPGLGESISEVEIGPWHKQVGEAVNEDEPIVDIESEKAALEISAPATGVLVEMLKETGAAAVIDEVIGRIDTEKRIEKAPKTDTPAPLPSKKAGEKPPAATPRDTSRIMPAARRLMKEKGIAADQVTPTGPGGRILKEDVKRAAEPAAAEVPSPRQAETETTPLPEQSTLSAGSRTETRTRMSRLRRTIARRLLEAKESMAMLTTFNEVDMTEVKRLRKEMGGAFLEKHGVKLGFMSFFVKAAVASIRDFPNLNARIEGDDIVESHFCDIGVAIGGGKGLVVPVLRNAEQMSFADIERQIVDFSAKATNNTLTLEELDGGTFTISNGGVFGSMLSTPIVNPPQSGIMGLHAIKDRPVAIDGAVVIRPVMYLALSYDHRIVDGREAVSFLKGVKDRIENPNTLLLEL